MEPSPSHEPSLVHKLRADRYKKDLEVAQRKSDSLNWANKDVSRKLYEANQLSRQLAVSLGFTDIIQANTVISRDPGAYHHLRVEKQARRIHELEQSLLEQRDAARNLEMTLEGVTESMRQLTGENELLRGQVKQLEEERMRFTSPSYIQHGRALPTTAVPPAQSYLASLPKSTALPHSDSTYPSASDTPVDALSLRMELIDLRERYDALLETKEKAAALYKQDYQKWRDFKRHLYEETMRNKKKKGYGAGMPPISRERRNTLSGPPKAEKARNHNENKENVDVNATNASRDVVSNDMPAPLLPSNLPRASHINTSETTPTSNLRKRKRVDPIRPAHAASSETEDDSQVVDVTIALRLPDVCERRRDNQPNQFIHAPSSETEDDSQAPIISRSDQPSEQHKLQEALVNTTHVVGRGVEDDADVSIHHGRESGEGRSAKPTNHTKKHTGKDYSEYKGRGRYAQTAQQNPDTTINAQFEINTARNGGLPFQFDAVVRNREERKHMNAGDCECCRDYYDAIGPLPPRLQQPQWRSPTNSPSVSKELNSFVASASATAVRLPVPDIRQRDSDIDQHKRDISRHRHNWERPSTPPGYWNIGFPTTQEASIINEQAKEMHIQKLEMVEREANQGDGRYRKR